MSDYKRHIPISCIKQKDANGFDAMQFIKVPMGKTVILRQVEVTKRSAWIKLSDNQQIAIVMDDFELQRHLRLLPRRPVPDQLIPHRQQQIVSGTQAIVFNLAARQAPPPASNIRMAVILAIKAADREPRRFVPHVVSVGPAPVHCRFTTKKYSDPIIAPDLGV